MTTPESLPSRNRSLFTIYSEKEFNGQDSSRLIKMNQISSRLPVGNHMSSQCANAQSFDSGRQPKLFSRSISDSKSDSGNLVDSENNTQSVDISNKYYPVPQVKLSDSNQSFSTNELVDKTDWLAALLYSKEFLIEWRKRFLPRPSRSTIITALTLYLIAICSILQKQQGGRWFATLVDTKLPGFTTTYQKASWHNFENIISHYINRDITTNNNLICQRRLIDSIDLSKESALIRFDSSWNKQLQKQFSGFFTGQTGLSADASKNHSEKSTFTSLPWYRIDACNPPTRIIFPSPSLTTLVPRSPALGEISSDTSEAAVGDTVGSTRAFASAEMKEDQSFLRSELPCNKSNTFTFDSLPYATDFLTGLPHFAESKNPLASSVESHIVSTKRSRFHLSDTITALQYCLPFSLSKERIFVENDTIPSKIDSPYSPFISDSDQSAIHLHTVDGLLSQRANAQWFENIKKTTFGDDFNTFQNVLRYLFYSQGLPLPNDFALIVESENDSLNPHSAPDQGEGRR